MIRYEGADSHMRRSRFGTKRQTECRSFAMIFLNDPHRNCIATWKEIYLRATRGDDIYGTDFVAKSW
jgi:hypothetical protein